MPIQAPGVTSKLELTLDQKLKAFDPKIYGGEVMASRSVGAEKVACSTTGEPVGVRCAGAGPVPASRAGCAKLKEIRGGLEDY